MQSKISRRKILIAGGAAALAAPIGLMGHEPAEAQDAPIAASDREVLAIPGSDQRFYPALTGLYPGLENDTTFQKIAPLALLITHKSGPGVRAYSVSWQITSSTGVYETAQYAYVAPGSKKKGRSVSTLASARQQILPVGRSALVTPFFTWTPAYYTSHPNPDWDSLLKPVEPGAFLVSDLPSATQVNVSLDGVLFKDWKVVGTDKYNLGWKIRTRRNAEHDEALEVYKSIKAGTPDSDIIATLQSHGNVARSNYADFRVRWYHQARRFHAQFLLRAFQDTDRPTFTKAITRQRNQKKTLFTKVTS